MKKSKRYTAPYIIAFHFGWDINDVSSQRLPKDHEVHDRWKWKKVGTHYDRDVWKATA